MDKKPGHKEELFKEFPPVSEKEWKEQVVKDLKGKPFDKLIWKTYENIDIEPFYTDSDLETLEYQTQSHPGESPFIKDASSSNNDWQINQEINHTDIKLANQLALNSLNNGADSLSFICEIRDEEYSGIPIQNKEGIALLLSNIDINTVPIHFKCGSSSIGILSLYINEAKKRGINPEDLSGSVDCDPLKDLSLNGSLSKGEENSFNESKSLILYLNESIPNFKGLKVNSSQFHDSGASITQELAFTLSAGVEYLDQLTDMDLTVDQITKQMIFSFSIGSNYFMEIAKLRAARMLWATIIELYKPKKESSKLMSIEVQNSSWNKTQYDPFVNLLRGTVETMAGALGGAGTITVRSFDSVYKKPDEFSLRMSRNTQLVLKNESYLERVADPSAGSYYIESLTNSIAKESWKLIQEIESNGGFVESLKSGAIQKAIEQTRTSRDMNIATRKDTILGVNQYPNSTEHILSSIKQDLPEIKIEKSKNKINTQDKLSIAFATEYLSNDGAYVGDLIYQQANDSEIQIEPLKPYRGAQVFEELRLATEKHAQDTGHTPIVFLLTIGNPSMRSARASFAANFFGCAGYEIINNIGFDTPEDGVKNAIENNADIVVICSSDNEYPNVTETIISKLHQINSEIKIIIAGNPTEHIKELEDAGVNDFIHMRSNALEILSKYQKVFGIEA
ncbi:MAG: methylmalonyl-CoA mutase [Thermodesulfobacteriota bacterium]|nr:MAG: methylmalonyl-CoA mutase [Thermodesulfobacteriota bacterium]